MTNQKGNESMIISKDFGITMKKEDGSLFITTEAGTKVLFPDDAQYGEVKDFYNKIKAFSPNLREQAIKIGRVEMPSMFTTEQTTEEPSESQPEPSKKDLLIQGLQGMIDFFSEFSFTPSFRFVNTISQNCKTIADIRQYIAHYFALIDSAYTTDVCEKIKSKEFSTIAKNILQYGKPTNIINARMKVYYGAAGTGKTTLAQTETDNRCIVCNASMLPSDLMEDFVFDSGNPTFNPSILCNCMGKGLPIVLDEINLLPFDSLRFLQGITDGKKSIIYKNREIQINDGFQIIGTMNLTLGGATYGLPEPLVDRCSEIREFTLSADQLAIAIIGDCE